MLEFFNRALSTLEKWICSAGLLTSTLLVFAQVLNRHWIHYEIMWLGDLALYIFVFSYILAIAFTASQKGHISVEMLKTKLLTGKPTGLAVYNLSMDLLSLIVILVFAIPVYEFFQRSLKYPEYGTLVRWFNTGWLSYALFAVVILSSVHLLQHLSDDIKEMNRSKKAHIEGGSR